MFVSSTFLDMVAERDELIKVVFPQLRRICERRGVAWSDVDLRWGITDEAKADEQVLPICLAEIDNCRPFFLCLLGDRYGWVPERIPEDLLGSYPWLAACGDRSVTEIEIRHGALNRPEAATQARFYFRDPTAVDGFYQETEPERRAKLAALKARIHEAGMHVCQDWRTPRELGDRVFTEIKEILDAQYPEGSAPDPLAAESAEHDYFAATRWGSYVGRREYFDRLRRHVESEDPPLAVLGAAGSGKSALLANWISQWRDTHPDELAFAHFTGASPSSADWGNLLRRIIGEVSHRFDLGIEIPTAAHALRAEFARVLHLAARRERTILVIDGLNHLDDREGAPDLVWMPSEIPPGVRIVVSTLPGRPLDELTARGYPTMHVEPLTPEERRDLTVKYLAQYGKKLGAGAAEQLATGIQTGNPLFLRTVLSELRVHGDHFTLQKRIADYLEAGTVEQLFGRVLLRHENDYELDRPGLVRDAMTLLWAARRGLTEPELLDLLGSGGAPLPAGLWSPLYLANDESLIRRGGLLNFSHEYLRRAVSERYLAGERAPRAVHQILADYFGEAEMGPRKLEELPWQLARAGNWPQLYDLLTSPNYLPTAYHAAAHEVEGYWTELEANSDLRMVQGYAPPDEAALDAAHLHAAGLILTHAGHLEQALAIQQALIRRHQKTGDTRGLAVEIGNVANILYIWNDLERASSLYQKASELYSQNGDLMGVATSLSNQGKVLQLLGESKEAYERFTEQERICRDLGYTAALQSALSNRASVLLTQGDLDEAEALYEEQRRICLSTGDREGLSVALDHLASIALDRRRFDQAERLCAEGEGIARSIGNKLRLAEALSTRASIRRARSDREGFVAALIEEEAARRAAGDARGVRNVVQRQASYLKGLGRKEEMFALHEREIRSCRETGDRAELQGWLEAFGVLLVEEGNVSRALEQFDEQEKICREIGHQRGLAACLGNKAALFSRSGEEDIALELWKEQAEICRVTGNRHSLAVALGNAGKLFWRLGIFERALERFLEQETLCEELGNFDLLQSCKRYLGEIYYREGNLEKAAQQFSDQARLCRALGNNSELADALARAAQARYAMPHLEGALQLLREEALVRRAMQDESGLKRSLRDQAVVLDDTARWWLEQARNFQEALRLSREACDAAAQSGDDEIREQTGRTLSRLTGV